MSVVSCTKSWHGASGSRSGTPGAFSSEYQAGWKVKTDSALDGPEVIFRYCTENADGRPYLGKEYRFGNDTDVKCFCTKIAPTKDNAVPTLWEVVGDFTPKNNSGKDTNPPANPDKDGNNTTNPLQWAPKCSSRTTQLSTIVEKAKFLGGMNGSALARWPVGTIGPMVNSARIPYLPPQEMDRSINVISFTFYAEKFAGKIWRGFNDAINTNTQKFVDNWLGYHDEWEPFTARIKGTDGTFNYQNGIKYYEITMEVWYDPLGWDRHILDQGEVAAGIIGGADARIPSIGDLLAVPEVVEHRTITGIDQVPVSGPVPFDGNGNPLRNVTADNRVYLDYRVYLNEKDFDPIFKLFINAEAVTLQ